MPERSSPNNGRNRLLHRFYEPLALLRTLDFTQGEKASRPGAEFSPIDKLPNTELRKQFVDALSYACDFEKGGHTTTAMILTEGPLTYHVACNRLKGGYVQKAEQHLEYIFQELGTVYDLLPTEQTEVEGRLFDRCVSRSEMRLRTYQKSLFKWLDEGINDSAENREDLVNLKTRFSNVQHDLQKMCCLCRKLMKHPDLNFVRRQIELNEQRGDRHCKFDKLRHYIGRIAHHVRIVKVMMEAGRRLHNLVEDPNIHFIAQEVLTDAIPYLRQKASLDMMAQRMLPAGSTTLPDVQRQLQDFDRTFHIVANVQKLYGKGAFDPIMHAEMIVLEYVHRHEAELGDIPIRYIGCSKPACFCCFLYIQHHPGNFDHPATHQKLYFNWMPPTNIPGVQDASTEIAKHEKDMLNKMVASIRNRFLEQVKMRGRRRPHFDSLTWDSFEDYTTEEPIPSNSEAAPHAADDGDDDAYSTAAAASNTAVANDDIDATESSSLSRRMRGIYLEDEDSEDEGGGVSLTTT